MKNILLNFQQVGGANALLPLIEELKKENRILITGRPLVCDNLAARNIPVKHGTGNPGQETVLPEKTPRWFKDFKPDILITDTIDFGRAPEGLACRNFWSWAKKEGIPSVAYVDCWWGYDNRFFPPGESSAPIIPDFIATIDEMAKKEMIGAGYDKKKIVVLGNPWFEDLQKMATQNTDIDALRKELNLPPEHFIILFVSQPLEKTFKGKQAYGFTEKSTLSALISSLNMLPKEVTLKTTLIVLLHPEEDNSISKSTIDQNRADFNICIKQNDQHRLVQASNLITGMFSMLLAEAVILKRPVISIQLNLKREEILITNKMGATQSVNTKKALESALTSAVISEEFRQKLLKNQLRFKTTHTPCNKWKQQISLLTPAQGLKTS